MGLKKLYVKWVSKYYVSNGCKNILGVKWV